MKKKIGRNDPCPCGSNKKFKKCCEKNMLGKKFLATKITGMQPQPVARYFGQQQEALQSLAKRKITTMPVNPHSAPLPTHPPKREDSDLQKDS
ncbi:MAG: SEC-C metal-binding domain-containing protein [Chlamydiota bacterium]